jgi:hypothetical protein
MPVKYVVSKRAFTPAELSMFNLKLNKTQNLRSGTSYVYEPVNNVPMDVNADDLIASFASMGVAPGTVAVASNEYDINSAFAKLGLSGGKKSKKSKTKKSKKTKTSKKSKKSKKMKKSKTAKKN